MSMGGSEMKQNKKTVSPMSNEGRNTYVIEHITDALLELMQDKPIEDISISELCETAGIGQSLVLSKFQQQRRYFAGIYSEHFSGMDTWR